MSNAYSHSTSCSTLPGGGDRTRQAPQQHQVSPGLQAQRPVCPQRAASRPPSPVCVMDSQVLVGEPPAATRGAKQPSRGPRCSAVRRRLGERQRTSRVWPPRRLSRRTGAALAPGATPTRRLTTVGTRCHTRWPQSARRHTGTAAGGGGASSRRHTRAAHIRATTQDRCRGLTSRKPVMMNTNAGSSRDHWSFVSARQATGARVVVVGGGMLVSAFRAM